MSAGWTPLDPTRCELGEGAIWLATEGRFFWFDIAGRRLYAAAPDGRARQVWDLPEITTALAPADDGRVVLSTETGLVLFDLHRATRSALATLAPPGTRSNDGRADPWGGMWVSTMGRAAEAGRGAIWRWYRGELRLIRGGLTIPNAICFDAAQCCAYGADTAARGIWRYALDPVSGWPLGEARLWLDLRGEGLNPDGAVIDAAGRMWVALWGAGRIGVYDRDGRAAGALAVPATQPSCPAFGGACLATLMVTTAWEGMDSAARAADPLAGTTFAGRAPWGATGLPEPAVRLG